jgi:alkanesulfonate monooxygenase SsuD/methylene tetrahydromethanopterin reductase-like flavin-dependent oxidoreductase (luciferase family)
MGAGWFEAEHRVHGIGAGSSPGERIDRLRASVSIIRGLVDGERVDHQSRWYTLQGARHAPRPVQRRLPILVGGEGRKMTLRLVAEQADMWSAQGSYDRLDRAVRDLQEHCRAVGRDPQTIEQLASRWIIIRDRATTAAEHRTVTERQHGMAEVDAATVVLGPPELIAESLRPIVALGFRHIVVNLRSPWDYETIARMPDVRDLLADRVG